MNSALIRSLGRFALAFLCLFCYSAHAQTPTPGSGFTLRVRLVRASPDQAPTDPDLASLADLLRNNMSFRSFRLLDSQSVPLPLPTARTLHFSGRFRLALEGPPNTLNVTLARDRQTILKTRAVLRPGAPLVIGGIPDGSGGTLLFVLDLPEGPSP